MNIPLRLLRPKQRRVQGFTLVELLTVMTIIGILAGLVLGTFKFIQEKAARSRAEAEIKGYETALESYKAENGDYPKNASSVKLLPTKSGDPTTNEYIDSGKEFYKALSGDDDGDFTNGIASTTGAKSYFEFKPNQLSKKSPTYIVDPWGNAYGYSTAQAESTPSGSTSPVGYNPTFDLWSTGNKTGIDPDSLVKWIKNW